MSVATPIAPSWVPCASWNGAVQVSKWRSVNSNTPRRLSPLSARRTPSSSAGSPANTSYTGSPR